MFFFTIRKYSDEVLCDVVPMHAGHILLGRPWQFDRGVMHDGFLNRHKVSLTLLSPKEVYEDNCEIERDKKRKRIC